MSNKIDDLRASLFDTLKALQDKENPMDVERAKAICQVSGQIIESAKVETEFVKVTGARGSGFIPDAAPAPALPNGQPPDSQRTPGNGITAVRRHVLQG